MKIHYLKTPIKDSVLEKLSAGDIVYLSGDVFTARDTAHKLKCSMIKKGRKLPFDIKGEIVYYCGPAPGRKKGSIGSCGPTTSSRMDRYTPLLLDKGIKAMIGKGVRSGEVVRSIVKNKAVYFAAPAGLGALLSKCVRKSEVLAFRELGPEAVYRFNVEDMPLIVAVDSKGKCIYKA
ncbi:MAG: fumarate hydratase C-terminal domain-containing protein [Candidatus Aureabacteria bacterium]|nr:fumarate hydratase C-terminal domain-containing protein [Candidatus Auribacterota bacterium]